MFTAMIFTNKLCFTRSIIIGNETFRSKLLNEIEGTFVTVKVNKVFNWGETVVVRLADL